MIIDTGELWISWEWLNQWTHFNLRFRVWLHSLVQDFFRYWFRFQLPHYSAVQNGIVNEFTSKIDRFRAIFVLGVWFFDQTSSCVVWDKNCSKNYNFCSRKMCCTILETRDHVLSSNMSKVLIRLHIFEKMGWSKLRVSPCMRRCYLGGVYHIGQINRVAIKYFN